MGERFMNFRDINLESVDGKYMSKRVMVNGQFVTLYSSNGQTWVSSPEEIPSLMERLENARITLNTAEKVAEGEGAAVAKPEGKEKAAAKGDEKAEQPKFVQQKYRMKGPKPRPILRQGGVVIQGTPIEPISASSTVLSFSSDVVEDEPISNRFAKKQSDKNAKGKPAKQASAKESSKKAALAQKVAAKKVDAKKVEAKKVVAKTVAKAKQVSAKPSKQPAKAAKPVKQEKPAKIIKQTKPVAAAKAAKAAKKAPAYKKPAVAKKSVKAKPAARKK